jgi:hypothetical protein
MNTVCDLQMPLLKQEHINEKGIVPMKLKKLKFGHEEQKNCDQT